VNPFQLAGLRPALINILTGLLLLFYCLPASSGQKNQSVNDTLRNPAAFPPEYRLLNLPDARPGKGGIVRVAVVDDGFRLSHKTLRDFIFTNKKEIRGNYQDDDENGFTDDLNGWDLADNDNNVSVPSDREDFFYHGTYVAGIITGIFSRYYGAEASKYLEIIPVKVVPNKAKNKYYTEGYKGIRYASDLGADIICCAWSGGLCGDEQKKIVAEAVGKGILVIGASGNFFSEKAEAPSSLPGVFCVASIDSLLHKSKRSNFGMRIDISAPGDSIYGPHPVADNAFIHENGTSPATALIAGCAAILKALNPAATAGEIRMALMNTAMPVDSLNLSYCGKLGAGMPDLARAAKYITEPGYRYRNFTPSLPEGTISYKKKQSPSAWTIAPIGAYNGIHLQTNSVDGNRELTIFNGDTVLFSGEINKLSRWQFFQGSRFRVALNPKSGFPKEMELQYYMETIDSTTLYCQGEQEITGDSGTITDGSGPVNYANQSACKWIITVPAGKRIRIEFPFIDTEPNVDYVWIFEGTGTLQENILAKFSGTNHPPVITTFGNQALIWFLTDSKTNGKGWEMKYTSVD
jgi:subtilisin family serine protease